MSYLVAKYNVWQKQFEENKKQKNVPSISAVPRSLSQSFFWFCLSLSSNDQKSGTVIFVKKIQTLVVYPLSPSKKDGKIQAASKEAAGVDSVHSTTTHTHIPTLTKFVNYSFQLKLLLLLPILCYTDHTKPNQFKCGTLRQFPCLPVWWMQIEFNHTIYLTEQNLLPTYFCLLTFFE